MKTVEEFYKEYFDVQIIPREVDIDTIFILNFAKAYHAQFKSVDTQKGVCSNCGKVHNYSSLSCYDKIGRVT